MQLFDFASNSIRRPVDLAPNDAPESVSHSAPVGIDRCIEHVRGTAFVLDRVAGKYVNADRLSIFSGKIRPETPVLRSTAGVLKVTLSYHGVHCQNTMESTIAFAGMRRY